VTSCGRKRLPRSTPLLLRATLLLCALLLTGCATAGRTDRVAEGAAGASSAAPELRVVYPPAGATLTASDSTFVFGSVRPPAARVTVNGVPARQAAGGGWLAYVPVEPGDFVFHVEARAAAGANSRAEPGAPAVGPDRDAREPGVDAVGPADARFDLPVRVPGAFTASWEGVLDSASVTPREYMELEPGDPLVLRFRGVSGLDARAVLGAGVASSRFVEDPVEEENVGRRVFGAAEAPPTAPPDSAAARREAGPRAAASWYRAEVVLPPPPATGPVSGEKKEGAPLWDYWLPRELAIEVVRSDSTLRFTLSNPVLLRDPSAPGAALLDDDPQRGGRTDGRVVGRTAPDGVYFLFLPNGTRVRTARRIGEFIEVQLDGQLSVWVAKSDLQPLPPGTPSPGSLVPVVRTRRRGEWTRIVVPLAEPLPVQVEQETHPARYRVTIFGATAATEFMRYDFGDSLVARLSWNQPARERFLLEVELRQEQPWGYRYGYEGSDFYLDVRRAPRLGGGLFGSILKHLEIVVDPGHSPDPGATGPTGYPEKDANLAVALKLARELEDEGAKVVLTRSGESPPEGLSLNDRTNLAAREGAHLLISVHHNALPDGVNPFENNGTSTYYYHPQSLPLARAVQRELLAALDLPDFGIAHGNLALVRPTEMPAVLVEAAFMMIPEQEELLRTEAFQEREARAIVRGIKRFLEEARRSGRDEGG
jgi:N-acetylmuramoyl-L-alanine amidase